MELTKQVTTEVKVMAPNTLNTKPGGTYNLNECSNVERMVAKLHVFQHHISLMIASLCESSENRIRFGQETEELASKLYSIYEPFIVDGIDPFKLPEHYIESMNLRDAEVMKQLNATDDYNNATAVRILSKYYDVSSSTVKDKLYFYLHDTKYMPVTLRRQLCFFDKVMHIEYDKEAGCIRITFSI